MAYNVKRPDDEPNSLYILSENHFIVILIAFQHSVHTELDTRMTRFLVIQNYDYYRELK